ncbi:hypothetical protein CCACVL1_17637 [Corchorus capsularis]|uniref:DUF7086 domain-containing protein n=1 Tax=Corchorus capsularis TaxID=210143 RepID=A0A1R3HQL9_COCAP|nr:hypothetical protein CCACVL1_17637 [Corchorus capsularis]
MAMTKSLFYLRFEEVPEEHEELLKLSLMTPYSSSFDYQETKQLMPCKPSSPKRWRFNDEDEETQGGLDLSLSIRPPWLPPQPPSQAVLLPASAPPHHQEAASVNRNNPLRLEVITDTATGPVSSYHQRPRARRNPFQAPKKGKSETVAPPYPWATTRRATVHSLEDLLSHGVFMISGDLECRECQEIVKIEYNLEEKFKEIADFIVKNKSGMHHRAPDVWMSPKLENCRNCGVDLKPVFNKKKDINWLFLLLGNMLGCCKLSELKYFCKHTKNHRTGAKDRVLYLTYLGLCKQLDPNGPFDF